MASPSHPHSSCNGLGMLRDDRMWEGKSDLDEFEGALNQPVAPFFSGQESNSWPRFCVPHSFRNTAENPFFPGDYCGT
jgi:hypothetical protein